MVPSLSKILRTLLVTTRSRDFNLRHSWNILEITPLKIIPARLIIILYLVIIEVLLIVVWKSKIKSRIRSYTGYRVPFVYPNLCNVFLYI